MKWATAVLLTGSVLAQEPEATPTPPIDKRIEFKVSLVGRRNAFHPGEIIPIELSFSSRTNNSFEIDQAEYDRSGRMDLEHFSVTPVEGVVDPLAEYLSEPMMGGGLRGSDFLKPKPWKIRLHLNEWVRFTKPGKYKVRVSSERVEKIDGVSRYGKVPVTAVANEVELEILPRDPEWETRAFTGAVKILDNSSSAKMDELNSSPALRALETLNFLGTREATRELALRLRGEDNRRDFVCYLGLVSSPERAVARAALEEELREPDRPIDDTFLSALIWLERKNANDLNSTTSARKVLEETVSVLENKRGEALRVTLSSLWDYVSARSEELLPKTSVEKLTRQLVEIFDQLPEEQQKSFLEYRWKDIRTPALLPLLRRLAGQDSRQLASIALQRWFELDPDGARAAIIREISKPAPRFGASGLGILPDQTLPEVDQLLISHLQGGEDDQSAMHLASLIARYATREILPQVLKKLDPNIGKWACAVQNPLLAYVLRVDPEAARSQIEKGIAARGKTFTACNRRLLEEISAIHYDPLLEQIALRALDDPDGDVAAGAADLLAKFGSGAAEAALWRHYEKWCKRWVGRELQVNLNAVKAEVGAKRDLYIGLSFVRAIVKGKGWLTDEPKLERLVTISKVPTIRHELDGYLAQWRQQPVTLTILCEPDFHAHVAQYNLSSLDALKGKLSQFVPDTKFVLSLPFDKTDSPCLGDLRAFLTSHGFSVTDSKQQDES